MAVISASPVFFPVTPPLLTIATDVSELVQVTFLLAPVTTVSSLTVLPVPFVPRSMESRFSEMALFFTVILQVDDTPFAVAMMSAVPAETAVTFPVLSTVATFLLLLLHTVFLPAPFTVAFNCSISPEDTALALSGDGAQYRTAAVLFNLMLGSTTVTRQVSRGKPIPEEIMAFPFLSAVTTPFCPSWSTTAIFSFHETHRVFLPSGSFSISSTSWFSSSPILMVAVFILMKKLPSA